MSEKKNEGQWLLTEENCITALCIFEELDGHRTQLHGLIREARANSKEQQASTSPAALKVEEWSDHGIFWLRQQCVDLCKQVDEVWSIAVELSGGVEFPVAFDWEFVPELVNHHLHLLGPPVLEFRWDAGTSAVLCLSDSPKAVAKKIYEKWEKEGTL